MQSVQDCLIYHMLGNSLRRLHVSRTKIGSLLTGWFAERLWADLAFKPFGSPEHPPNTSFPQHALLFQSSIQVTTKIFNRWKVKARRVQSADCHDTDNRKRGSRKISCKNMMWEDFAICQGWVGEKPLRALRDAQLHCMPKFVTDCWCSKKRKLPAIWVKALFREHKKRSLGHSLKKIWEVPWSQSRLSIFKRSFVPPTQQGPQDPLSWNSVWYTIRAQWWLYTHKPFCILWLWHQLGAKINSHTHGALGPATRG